MLYDEDIEFKDKEYKNISHLLYLLIKDGTLKLITVDEKSILLNILIRRYQLRIYDSSFSRSNLSMI